MNNFFRWAKHDTTLPRGGGPDGKSPCFVPAGAFVQAYFHAAHWEEAAWGPDADQFRPERWYDAALKPGWNYIPFSGGGRVCPGQQFGLVEASYTLVRLLQAFSVMENRDDSPYLPKQRIGVFPAHGVHVAFRR